MPPKEPKYPCLACGKNVSSNSISCNVCMRWSHAACSGLDPGVLKYFELQQTESGSHSWSCKGCNIAYAALNTRIRQIENRTKILEQQVTVNTASCQQVDSRVDKVEATVKNLEEKAKSDKKEVMEGTIKEWSKEQREREARRDNVVVYGLEEPPRSITVGSERQELDKIETARLFAAMDMDLGDDDVKFMARIGKLIESNKEPRPLKISFRDKARKEMLFASARRLPRTNYQHVSIAPDLTDRQREEEKEMIKEVERLNENMTEDEALNYEYRCVGRKGERTIQKTRVRSRGRGAFRGRGSHRGNNRRADNPNLIPLGSRVPVQNRDTDQDDSDGTLTDSQPEPEETNKRTRESSEETSPPGDSPTAPQLSKKTRGN